MKRPYLIANPIYDGVFKALMEDLEIARGFLSVILGVEIESLRFNSQESAVMPPEDSPEVTGTPRILRLDFCAVIRTPAGGHSQVIIELQKTRLSGDVLRFRQYLSTRYSAVEEIVDPDFGVQTEALPLLCVYLIGFVTDERLPMATRVERHYFDAVSGRLLELPAERRPEFIEKLTHDAWFVQIPLIRGIGKTRMERVLSVFDQSKRLLSDGHRLDYEPADAKLDRLLARIVRRLHKLQANPKMERIMTAEDVFELEQKRIHEALAREARRERKSREEAERAREQAEKDRDAERNARISAEKRSAEAEQEIARLRKLLEDSAG